MSIVYVTHLCLSPCFLSVSIIIFIIIICLRTFMTNVVKAMPKMIRENILTHF